MAGEILSVCTICANRFTCGVSASYVKQCANYSFKRRLTPESQCATCRFVRLCLIPDDDKITKDCPKYAKE